MTSGLAESTSGESRQAALFLHGLSAADRSWLLGELSPAQRDHLMPLLDELQALGIPADPVVVPEVAPRLPPAAGGARAAAAAEAAPVKPAATMLLALDAHARGQLAELLMFEPPRLVARLLSSGDWPWEHEVLARLDVERQRQIAVCRASFAARTHHSMLNDRVVHAVATQLDAMRDGARVPSGAGVGGFRAMTRSPNWLRAAAARFHRKGGSR